MNEKLEIRLNSRSLAEIIIKLTVLWQLILIGFRIPLPLLFYFQSFYVDQSVVVKNERVYYELFFSTVPTILMITLFFKFSKKITQLIPENEISYSIKNVQLLDLGLFVICTLGIFSELPNLLFGLIQILVDKNTTLFGVELSAHSYRYGYSEFLWWELASSALSTFGYIFLLKFRSKVYHFFKD